MGLANAPTYGLTLVRYNGRGRKITTGVEVQFGTFGTTTATDLTLAQTGNFTPVGPNPTPSIPSGQTPPTGPQLFTPSFAAIIAWVALITNNRFWVRVLINLIAGTPLQMVSRARLPPSRLHPLLCVPRGTGTHAGRGAAPPPNPPPLTPRLPPNPTPRPQRCRGPQCP